MVNVFRNSVHTNVVGKKSVYEHYLGPKFLTKYLREERERDIIWHIAHLIISLEISTFK